MQKHSKIFERLGVPKEERCLHVVLAHPVIPVLVYLFKQSKQIAFFHLKQTYANLTKKQIAEITQKVETQVGCVERENLVKIKDKTIEDNGLLKYYQALYFTLKKLESARRFKPKIHPHLLFDPATITIRQSLRSLRKLHADDLMKEYLSLMRKAPKEPTKNKIRYLVKYLRKTSTIKVEEEKIEDKTLEEYYNVLLKVSRNILKQLNLL